MGKKSYPAGRHLRNSDQTEPPTTELAQTIKNLGFEVTIILMNF